MKIKKYYNKKLVKDLKFFLKKEKKKSNNMALSVTKISQKMKNKSFVSIEKNVKEREKTLYYNYKKLFDFRKFCFFIKTFFFCTYV